MIKYINILILAVVLFGGCNKKDEEDLSNLVSPAISFVKKATTDENLSEEQKNRLSEIHKKAPIREGDEVFINSKSIRSYGKPTLMVFGSETCPYCELLKDDKNLIEKLQQLSAYYIEVEDPSSMEIEHQNELVPANAVVLKDIYQVTNVPSFVFRDEFGKRILFVPGYMKKEVFLAVLDFVNTKAHENISIKEYLQSKKLVD